MDIELSIIKEEQYETSYGDRYLRHLYKERKPAAIITLSVIMAFSFRYDVDIDIELSLIHI